MRGGQRAADAHLAAFDVSGYAERRNDVWPREHRGASRLSPWVRHGLLHLGRLWEHVADAPAADRDRFRDELLWQEYARHLYARLGRATGRSLRFAVPERVGAPGRPIGSGATDQMACLELVLAELAEDGWLPNQARLWLSSWWVGHAGGGWRDGEDWLFAQLLDGSRAANRLGWQWVAGAATGSPWQWGRHHVELRAPGLCGRCHRCDDCPLEPGSASADRPLPIDPEDIDPRLTPAASGRWRRRPPETAHLADALDDAAVTGPLVAQPVGGVARPEVVWLTAESLGDDDPALTAHPDLPALFVFDAPLLAALRLSGARLTFLAETLADLATRRPVEVWRGDPAEVLAGRSVTVTFAPVPGFATRAAAVAPVEVHPWPWLVRPASGPLHSYSAWRRALGPNPVPERS